MHLDSQKKKYTKLLLKDNLAAYLFCRRLYLLLVFFKKKTSNKNLLECTETYKTQTAENQLLKDLFLLF